MSRGTGHILWGFSFHTLTLGDGSISFGECCHRSVLFSGGPELGRALSQGPWGFAGGVNSMAMIWQYSRYSLDIIETQSPCYGFTCGTWGGGRVWDCWSWSARQTTGDC